MVLPVFVVTLGFCLKTNHSRSNASQSDPRLVNTHEAPSAPQKGDQQGFANHINLVFFILGRFDLRL